jgi:hypothetical protein
MKYIKNYLNFKIINEFNTNEIYTKDDLILFHIHGGGGNNEILTSESFGKITDCPYWDDFFPSKEDDEGLLDASGNEIMDADEYNNALLTGEGRLVIDGNYNTYYTSKLKDLSDDEFKALDENDKKIYLIVVLDIDEFILDKFDFDLNEIYDEKSFPKYLNVNKNEYEVEKMIGGQYRIFNHANNMCIYGGDSANDDFYNKELMDEIYDDWDGTLTYNGKDYKIEI